ncbi:MAG: hypothetical protein GY856_12890, partial [bacterium]|nr:hypothetical protein [bacterium]
IQSNCYSDCEIDEDCSEGDGCYLRVCRPLCEFENTACPAKSYCATADGETGYCMPMAATSGKQTDVEGSFLLSTDRLSLSNMTDSASFTVFNNAPMPMKFIVRKVSHTELTDDGAETDEEMPLFWTRVASGGVAACEEDDGSGGDGASGNDGGASSDEENVAIDVLIEGQGATAELTLCDIVNDTIAVWNGVIEVGNDQLGYQQIRLDYKSSPDGQWSGKIYYFANFGADNLDEWLEDKTSEKLASVGNALIWRWAALRRGQITLENFRAALTSTKTGSWSWATVQESCPEPMGACYPYKDEDGMESFTNDIYERPIPSGMAELPVTLNLRVDPDDDKLLKGKIVSSETLHYAGDPAIQIALESASNECVSDTLGACLNYVSKIGAEIVVGGRYLPDPSDSSC